MKIWDVKSGTEIKTLTGPNSNVFSVAFNPEGTLLAAGFGGAIKIWDVESGIERQTLQAGFSYFLSMIFNSQGNLLAAGNSEGTVSIWDVTDITSEKEDRKIKTLLNPSTTSDKGITSIIFNPQENLLISGSQDKTIRIWDVDSGREIRTLDAHSTIKGMTFNPQGNLLSAGTFNEVMQIWDINSGTQIKTFKLFYNDMVVARISSAAFNPQGTLLATDAYGLSHHNTVGIWDVISGTLIQNLMGHRGSIDSVAFNSLGTLLATGSHDKMARIWELYNLDDFKAVLTTKARTDLFHEAHQKFNADPKQPLDLGQGDLRRIFKDLPPEWQQIIKATITVINEEEPVPQQEVVAPWYTRWRRNIGL